MDDDTNKAPDSLAQSSHPDHTVPFTQLVQGLHDYAVAILSPHGMVLSWNLGAEMMTGYAAREMIGRPYECLYMEKEIQAGTPHSLLRQAAVGGRVKDEGWRLRKDGSQLWLDRRYYRHLR